MSIRPQSEHPTSSGTKPPGSAALAPSAAPAPAASIGVNLGPRSYRIELGAGNLTALPQWIASWQAARSLPVRTGKVLLVTDENVKVKFADPLEQALRLAGWTVSTLAFPAGEATKSLAAVSAAYDALAELRADRNSLVIAVGGGVIGDLAGFAAATYNRGILFVQVPTTLLAQVDSSVGGKVGVNHARGKNLIGAFHQPLGVLIDLSTLQALPEREYRAGLAEVAKYGVILDEPFFAFLEQNVATINNRDLAVLQHVVRRCCELKAQVVETDEYEQTGVRAVLNYGHTFAHAFENLAGYGSLLHGEAVSIGMSYAARLAVRLKRIPADFRDRQHRLLTALQLPTALPASMSFSTADILDIMRLDKKTLGNKLRFVLPTRLGHVELVDDVPESAIRDLCDGILLADA